MKNQTRFLYFLVVVMIIGAVVGYTHLTGRIDALESELLAESSRMATLFINGGVFDRNQVVTVDGRHYLSYQLALAEIDPTLTLSNSGQRVYVKPALGAFDLPDEALNEFLKTHLVDLNIPLAEFGETRYLPLEDFARTLGLVYGETGDDFWIFTREALLEVGMEEGQPLYVNRNLNLVSRILPTDQTLVACAVLDAYFVAGETFVGYAAPEDLTVLDTDFRGYSALAERETVSVPEPFLLVWDQINNYSESVAFERELVESHADVISPTVMELNINGIVINIANPEYVQWAHDEGMAVWALVSNAFNPEWTHEMLIDDTLVDRFIAQLVTYALIYEYDGINLDFENVYLEDQQRLSDFVARLSEVLGMTDLVLSMDVTVPGGSDQWSKVYDREALGESVDYLMIMAYDEFWASSDESGPVASIPWTLEGLEATLALVDHEKVVLGIPGYMRVWKESGSRTESSVLSVKNRQTYLEDNGFEAAFDETLGVNYAEKRIGGVLHRVWLEDALSMGQRMTMQNDYDLPGVAVWRRGFLDMTLETLIDSRLE